MSTNSSPPPRRVSIVGPHPQVFDHRDLVPAKVQFSLIARVDARASVLFCGIGRETRGGTQRVQYVDKTEAVKVKQN